MIIRPLEHGDFEGSNIPGAEFYNSDLLKETKGWVIDAGAEIVAIGGITRMWSGVGEAWVIAKIGVNPLFLHRAGKQFFQKIPQAMELHRVHAHTFVEDAHIHRWLMMLGFEDEGLRRGWHFDGRDARAFALLFPKN